MSFWSKIVLVTRKYHFLSTSSNFLLPTKRTDRTEPTEYASGYHRSDAQTLFSEILDKSCFQHSNHFACKLQQNPFRLSSSDIVNDAARFRKQQNQETQLYLHVAPCGDWWMGTSIFAAKHLQPDYVCSVPLPQEVLQAWQGRRNTPEDKLDSGSSCDNTRLQTHLESILEDFSDEDILRRIYDEKRIPSCVVNTLVREASKSL